MAISLLGAAGWAYFAMQLKHTHAVGSAGMFPSDLVFTDFYLYKPTFEVFHTDLFFQATAERSRFAYPALVAPLYRFFYLQHHRVSWYLLFTGVVWAALLAYAAQVYRALRPSPLGTLAVLASVCLWYPALFLLERGNMELFVWGVAAAGILLWTRGWDASAATCFGLAAGLKLYPVLLLALLIGRRRWFRHMVLGVVVAGTATLLALVYAGPTVSIAAQGFLGGVTGFQTHYANTVRTAELRFDHSFFSLWKIAAGRTGFSLPFLSRVYYAVGAVVFSCLFVLTWRRAWINRVIFLSTCMILLPPVSYEYTIVHLYLPTLLLMSVGVRFGLRWAGVLILGLLLLLMVPGDLLELDATFQAGQIQSLFLLLVAFCCPFSLSTSTEQQGSEQVGAPAVPWPHASEMGVHAP